VRVAKELDVCSERLPGDVEDDMLGKIRQGKCGTSAATLAADLAGESPAGGNCPVATVVISGNGEGDRTVESPEVKVSAREVSNSAGCSNGDPVSPEIA
jgi:hypothetical protein